MKIIDKYIASSFIAALIFSTLFFMLFYVVVDVFSHLDEIIKGKLPLKVTLDYYMSLLPVIWGRISPLAVLLATLFHLGGLTHNNELTAMKAGGLSLYRLIVPILLIAVCVSVFHLVVGELAIPRAARKTNAVKRLKMKGLRAAHTWENILYNDIEGRRWFYISCFDAKQKRMEGVQISTYREDGIKSSQIDAKIGEWQEGTIWAFERVTVRKLDASGQEIGAPERVVRKEIDIKRVPEDFSQERRSPEEMSFRELRHYIEKLARLGFLPRGELVSLHSKVASPFLGFIMALIAIPFATKPHRGGVMLVGFGEAMAIGLILYGTTAVCNAFGQRALPPVMAAWIPNFIFASASLTLLFKMRK